jgi:hypothetical protein
MGTADQGMGLIDNTHSTDVESPRPPRVSRAFTLHAPIRFEYLF